MKSTLTGKINKVDKIGGFVTIQITAVGKVKTNLINAQETSLSGEMIIKSVIADSMKIGAVLTITVSDEETESSI